jgi:hypothetical protein
MTIRRIVDSGWRPARGDEMMNMTSIQVFDPPMCCSTGVCGPQVDPVLPRFAADLEWLSSRGVRVERFNLAQQPQAFAASELVRAALGEHGNEALPLIVVGGAVASHGRYPEREELARLAGVRAPQLRRFTVAAAPCCAPSRSDDDDGCC